MNRLFRFCFDSCLLFLHKGRRLVSHLEELPMLGVEQHAGLVHDWYRLEGVIRTIFPIARYGPKAEFTHVRISFQERPPQQAVQRS